MAQDGEWVTCWKCKTTYFLPKALWVAAKATPKISFWCPYGHSAHVPEGPTDTDKAIQRAQRAEQKNAMLTEERDAALRREAAQKGQVTRLKKRAKGGACPCCNRTFQNLHRHMKTKHPEFGDEIARGM